MSQINQYVQSMSAQVYQQLSHAVETGKWDNGEPLSDAQKAHTLQLVIAYQNQFNDNPAHFTVTQSGEIHMEEKSVLKTQFSEPESAHIHKIKL